MTATQPSRRKVTKRKRTTAKKTGSDGAASRRSVRSRFDRIEDELPAELRDFTRRIRRDLTALERQIDSARNDTRRGLTRLLRDVSHELGRLEAKGEREWRRLSYQARRDVVKVLRRLERAIEPPKPKRKAEKTRSTAARTRPPIAAEPKSAEAGSEGI
jgi:hypothetical protein